MWECKYGKEPLDTRLCLLRLIRKVWLVVLMSFAGAILFGGIYYLTHVVYGPAKEYVAESEYYIEYVNAVTQEQQYTFYNKETWESLIHTDIFMDEVMNGVREQTLAMDSEITRDEVSNAIFATLLTDVRIVHVTVTTNNPYFTVVITNALEEAFIKFGESQREIDTVRAILIQKKATLTTIDNRTVRACILGAVVFASFTLFAMYLYVVLDTSIYIPLEFERRYGIVMETDQNYKDCRDEEADTCSAAESTKRRPNVLAESVKRRPDVSAESVYVRETSDGTYILYVKSKDHNGPLIEKIIRELTADNKVITKAVLLQPDEKLIKWYFKTGKLL